MEKTVKNEYISIYMYMYDEDITTLTRALCHDLLRRQNRLKICNNNFLIYVTSESSTANFFILPAMGACDISFYSVFYCFLNVTLWLTVIHKQKIKIKKGCRWYRKFITEEDTCIIVLTEPDNNFLTYVTSESSTAKGNSYSITDYYFKNNLDLGKLLLGIECCLD